MTHPRLSDALDRLNTTLGRVCTAMSILSFAMLALVLPGWWGTL